MSENFVTKDYSELVEAKYQVIKAENRESDAYYAGGAAVEGTIGGVALTMLPIGELAPIILVAGGFYAVGAILCGIAGAPITSGAVAVTTWAGGFLSAVVAVASFVIPPILFIAAVAGVLAGICYLADMQNSKAVHFMRAKEAFGYCSSFEGKSMTSMYAEAVRKVSYLQDSAEKYKNDMNFEYYEFGNINPVFAVSALRSIAITRDEKSIWRPLRRWALKRCERKHGQTLEDLYNQARDAILAIQEGTKKRADAGRPDRTMENIMAQGHFKDGFSYYKLFGIQQQAVVA